MMYKIYAGFSGHVDLVDCQSFENDDEAMCAAREAAVEIYETNCGTNDIPTFEDIAAKFLNKSKEDFMLDDLSHTTIMDIFSVYQEEIEYWISYWAQDASADCFFDDMDEYMPCAHNNCECEDCSYCGCNM